MRRIAAVVGVLSLYACATHAPSATDWHGYQSQVRALTEQARYKDALPVAQQELSAAAQALSPDSLEFATVLEDVAALETTTGRYTDAQSHWQAAVDICRKRAPGSAQLAGALDGMGRNEDTRAAFPDATAHYQEALAIHERLGGPDAPLAAESLTGLAHIKTEVAAFDEADALLKRALPIREKDPGAHGLDLARTLNVAAFLALYNGDDDGGRKILARSLALLDVPGEPPTPEMAQALDFLGNADLDQSRFDDAATRFQHSLDIYETTIGDENEEVANAYNDLARYNDDNSLYAASEDYYKRSIALYIKLFGPDNENVSSIKDSLAQMYDLIGDYPRAEPLFRDAIATDEKLGDVALNNLAYDLNNYAQHKKQLGEFAEAEPLMQRTLAIFQKLLPPDHPNIATAVNNLAELYSEQDKYAEAEPLAKQSLAMTEKAYGPDNPVTAVSINNLAEVYEGERKFDLAEPLYLRSLAIYKKTLRPGHPDIARQMHNIADFYGTQGRFKEADDLYPKALAMASAVYGADSEMAQKYKVDYAITEYAEGRWMQADSLFSSYFSNMRSIFDHLFLYLGEKDRLDFTALVADNFGAYFSFCLKFHKQDPALAGKMYDILLWRKGLVGGSIAALRAKIASSGDSTALSLLDQLSAAKTKLAGLLDTPGEDPAAWQAEVERQQQHTDDLEKQLVQRSASLAEEKQLQQVTWQAVRDALKPGEAAVELVRFDFDDGRKSPPPVPAYYVALVVRPGMRTGPQFIVVGTVGDRLNSAVTAYGSNLNHYAVTASAGDQAAFYQAFWAPLASALEGAHRVYLSPDGVYNQASLGIVKDQQGQLLMERYDLRIVTSTRDVVRAPEQSVANAAVLLGGPDFALPAGEYLAAVSKLEQPQNPAVSVPMLATNVQSNNVAHVSRDLSAGGKCPLPDTGILCPLPGAAEEVGAVDGLLTQKQWQASLYQGDQALEEAVKSVHHPRLLHIATHGFFLPDQKSISEDPMLRSGLYFAGADNTLAGNLPPEGADNGVLTAYEAAQLDLEGTELVVLSACDTGLGSAKSGEGVFGLNRALQEAGAQAVVMSMWSVPDQETRELMQLFYANWLGGMEKHEALRQAELKEREVVKARYGHDLPYYWGAFVMVGR